MPKWKSVLFLSAGLLLVGFTAVQLKDVETAVIQADYFQAERLARHFLAHHAPGDDYDAARYYLGLSQMFQEEYQPARTVFKEIVLSHPHDSLGGKAQIGIIDSFLLQGDYAMALARAQALLKSRQRGEFESLIYFKIARSYLKLTQWAEARVYLNKIIKEFPESVEAHLAQQLLNEEQYFAVQVGAFLDAQRARRLMADLQKRGEYAYIIETHDQAGRKFYRVRIGRFSRLQEAQTQEQRLSELGYPTLIYP